MNIEQLNKAYGISGNLEFVEGNGNFSYIRIKNRKAESLISLYAAQVLSYRPHTETEDLLFLGENAYYQPGKAIRGGIPLCWPWFGPDHSKRSNINHGFARTHVWTVGGVEAVSDYETKLQLKLSSSPEIKTLWPHDFELTFEITVGEELILDLKTRNSSTQPFVLTQAFHPYFRVGNIEQARVFGLENKSYIDKLEDGEANIQRGPLSLTGETDRIYDEIEKVLTIDDVLLGRQIQIHSNSKNIVVWNPWLKASANMPDLKPNDYRDFICVEPGQVIIEPTENQPESMSRLRASFGVKRE